MSAMSKGDPVAATRSVEWDGGKACAALARQSRVINAYFDTDRLFGILS
jgi:hypothetical protein